MLSLCELRRAIRVLDAGISGHRVQGIVQPDGHCVVLTTYGRGPEAGSGRKQHLRLSCRPESARVSLVEMPPEAPPAPPAFARYLRAHLLGARIGEIRLLDDDRQLAIRLHAREGDWDLLVSVLGRRSNVYLLDAAGCVAAALRPLRQTRPELSPGGPWRPPASSPPGIGEDRFAAEPDWRYLRAIEEAYATREREQDFAALCQRLERALRKDGRALDRKLEKLARELEEAREATHLERQGELLKSALARVRRGDTEVVVSDFETGEPVTIALDPARSPSENLERVFRRYRKAVRALTKASARQDAVRAARAELEGLEAELRLLADRRDPAAPGELEEFAARPTVRRLLAKHAPAPPARRARPDEERERELGGRKVPARLAPRRYRSAGGLEIWVGRSDAGNDFLTTRLARGSDLFFHLDGAPGSHVVLRTEGRSDSPSESVLDACELAAHFSKFKDADRVDVHVVPIKYVKKPKGAKPGLVTVHGGKTIHLRRRPGRLERLLAARIDDD